MFFVMIDLSQERNVVEAAARGAMGAIAVVASILVNLIAFIALMAFLDAILSYLGSRVGYPEFSFQVSGRSYLGSRGGGLP